MVGRAEGCGRSDPDERSAGVARGVRDLCNPARLRPGRPLRTLESDLYQHRSARFILVDGRVDQLCLRHLPGKAGW